MRNQLKEYLAENHSADDIVKFIKEMTNSPDAEKVYFEMAYAIRDLSAGVNAAKKELERL